MLSLCSNVLALQTGVHVCQISTLSVGYASWCDDCMQGHKILRWDPQRKQHFFTEFVHPDTPPRPLINIEESQAGSDLRSVNKGAAIELVMVEPPGEDDSQIEIPITMPKNTKKRVHKVTFTVITNTSKCYIDERECMIGGNSTQEGNVV